MPLATDEGEQSLYSKMRNRHRERQTHMFEHEPSDRKNREACVDGLSRTSLCAGPGLAEAGEPFEAIGSVSIRS